MCINIASHQALDDLLECSSFACSKYGIANELGNIVHLTLLLTRLWMIYLNVLVSLVQTVDRFHNLRQ